MSINPNIIVLLLHGLGRDHRIMMPMQKALIAAGFDTSNLSYLSTQYPIELLSQQIADRIREQFPNRTYYFVTHSLGSLILRYIQAHAFINPIDRVVMLGPPNHGTPVIDYLRRFTWFRNHWGPAALELAIDEQGIYHHLPEPIHFDCGIIAGNKTLDPWFSWFILKGTNDGKVTIDSTYLKGMRDHVVIPCAHSRLPSHKTAIAQTIYFLKENQFMHE